jgi:hypothetical protein
MCIVSINIDEAALRDMRPELNSTAAIRLWAQEMINHCIQNLEYEDTETISIEEARALTHAAIREVYAEP